MKKTVLGILVMIALLLCLPGCSENYPTRGESLTSATVTAPETDEETEDMQTDKEDMPYKPIQVNTTFTDNMVLQRDKKVRIFGYGGNSGETVRVLFDGKTFKGIIDETGWEVFIDAMPACAEGKTLKIVHRGKTIKISNVVVGEVWICGGQSNMAVTVQYILSKDNKVESEYSEYGNWSSVRVFNRNARQVTGSPVIESTVNEKWRVVKSFKDVKNSSAAAVAFALNLAHMLGDDTPVGVINCSYGGSPIEGWISPDGMKKLKSYFEQQNSVYYNGMLYNILGYSSGGFFWYQGCANAQPQMAPDYVKQFNVLLSEIRAATGDNKLPAVVMQLVQFDDWCSWTAIRQVQWDLMDMKNVYTVCGIDLGCHVLGYNEACAVDGIHPVDKWTVGKRAAGVAASEVLHLDPPEDGTPYGISPEIVKAVWENGEVRVSVSRAVALSASAGTLSGFEVRSLGKWLSAEATVEGNEIILRVDGLERKPIQIRYLQANAFPEDTAFIYNEYGLPVAPIEYIVVDSASYLFLGVFS